MSNYRERDLRYEEMTKIGYRQIMEIAKDSPYPYEGDGMQYCDFIVGNACDKVEKVRVLVDFRGEYFSSFFLDAKLPNSIVTPIRNRINFTAREAYDYIVEKAKIYNI